MDASLLERLDFSWSNQRKMEENVVDDFTKHYTYILQIYFRGLDEPQDFKVRKKESVRFRNNLDSFGHDDVSAFFFVCQTIEGKYVAVNIAQIQAIHVLWEPSAFPEDEKHYEGLIKILLLNRKMPIEVETEEPDQLYDFYSDLEHGPEVVGRFVSFSDENGEELIINIEQLLCIECPSSLVNEGYEIVKERDGLSRTTE